MHINKITNLNIKFNLIDEMHTNIMFFFYECMYENFRLSVTPWRLADLHFVITLTMQVPSELFLFFSCCMSLFILMLFPSKEIIYCIPLLSVMQKLLFHANLYYFISTLNKLFIFTTISYYTHKLDPLLSLTYVGVL
jgi:hypothetical protein